MRYERQGRWPPQAVWIAAVGAVLSALYFILSQDIADTIYCLFAPAAGTAMFWRARSLPACRAPWRWFGAGLWLVGVGDVWWTLADHLEKGGAPFPSPAEAAYLSGLACTIIGVVVLLRARRRGPDVDSLLDAAVVAVAYGLVLYVYVMAPQAGDTGMSVFARVVALATPVADVALFLAVLRLAFTRAAGAARLLVTTLLISLTADAIYAVLSVQNRYVDGMWLDGAWLAVYTLWALLAWHPDAAGLTRADPAPALPTWRRAAVLAAAPFVAPVVLGIQGATHGHLHLPEVVTASAILFTLVAVRLGRIVAALRGTALCDPLTGLPNRAQVEQHLDGVLAKEARVAVLFVDLDRFKQVNDLLGHAAGDELLRQIGRRLQAHVRGRDVVARYAGDEFVAVLPGARAEDALEVAERLMGALVEPLRIDGSPVFPSASIGVAVGAAGTTDADALLRDADAAMFRAKTRTDSRIQLFDSEMRAVTRERLELEAALRSSDDDAFEVYFQPVVPLAGDAMPGFEALVRWRGDDGALRLPAEFLAVAEESGVIVDIGRLVLESACRFGVAWEGEHNRPMRLFVNLSTRELTKSGLVPLVERVLDESGFDRHRLVLEVSERALGEHDRDAVLRNLLALDVAVALDDFGTGTSALPQLREHPYAVVKLDRSLVDGVAVCPRQRAIVHGVVVIAGELGVEVVAEGVEQAADLEQLRRLGCHSVQGFLVGRPGPASTWVESMGAAPDGSTSLRPV